MVNGRVKTEERRLELYEQTSVSRVREEIKDKETVKFSKREETLIIIYNFLKRKTFSLVPFKHIESMFGVMLENFTKDSEPPF